MACGSEMTDLTEEDDEKMQFQPPDMNSSSSLMSTAELAHHLGQVSLESSPVLSSRASRRTEKYSLRDLEIQQTIGLYIYIYMFRANTSRLLRGPRILYTLNDTSLGIPV